MGESTRARQVRRRGDQNVAIARQRPDNQAALSLATNAQRHIHLVLDEVEVPVRHEHLHRRPGVTSQKAVDQRNEQHVGQAGWSREPECAGDILLSPFQGGLPAARRLEEFLAVGQKLPPRVVRSSSRTPSDVSNALIFRLSVETGIPTRRAASEKPPCCTTRANNAIPARLRRLLIVPLLQQSLLLLSIVLIVERCHIDVESQT